MISAPGVAGNVNFGRYQLLMPLFIRQGREIVQTRMTTTRIAPPLDERKERHPRFAMRLKSAPIEQLTR